VIGVLAGVAVIGAGIGVGVYVAAQAAATAGENIALTTGVEIPQLTGIPATNPPPPSAV
jgi:flagellar biosynthesis protein FliR